MPEEPQCAPVPAGWTPHQFAGTCARCTNSYDRLYERASATGTTAVPLNRQRLCVHCCELEAAGGKQRTGGGGGKQGASVSRPLNQPGFVSLFGKYEPCVWCRTSASPRFSTFGIVYSACGWAHAGLWLDWCMEQIFEPYEIEKALAEDVAYVRESLGLPPNVEVL